MGLLSKIHPIGSSIIQRITPIHLRNIIFTIIILGGLVSLDLHPVSADSLSQQSGINNFSWASQAVDAPRLFNYMGDRSLRLDSNDHAHIAFGGDHLYYAYYDGSNWNFETVDPADGVGLFASLALDTLDHPHISYYDSLHGERGK